MAEQGTFDELIAQNGDFAEFLKSYMADLDDDKADDDEGWMMGTCGVYAKPSISLRSIYSLILNIKKIIIEIKISLKVVTANAQIENYKYVTLECNINMPTGRINPELVFTHPSFPILLNSHSNPTQTSEAIECLRGGESPQRWGDASYRLPTGSTLEKKEKEEEEFGQC